MNQPSITINFTFNYDGTTSTVLIDTRRDPMEYANGCALHPMFYYTIAKDVIDVNVGIGSSTATIDRNGIMTVVVPTQPAGSISATAILLY